MGRETKVKNDRSGEGGVPGTFCLLLRPGLLGLEVGECLEIGVESWLLEPVPLAARAQTSAARRGKEGGIREEEGRKKKKKNRVQ